MSKNTKQKKQQKLSFKNFLKKYINYIATALAFVIALAWNEAFKPLFKLNENLSRFGPLVYAVLITGIIILLIYLLEIASINISGDIFDKTSIDKTSIDKDSVNMLS